MSKTLFSIYGYPLPVKKPRARKPKIKASDIKITCDDNFHNPNVFSHHALYKANLNIHAFVHIDKHHAPPTEYIHETLHNHIRKQLYSDVVRLTNELGDLFHKKYVGSINSISDSQEYRFSILEEKRIREILSELRSQGKHLSKQP